MGKRKHKHVGLDATEDSIAYLLTYNIPGQNVASACFP